MIIKNLSLIILVLLASCSSDSTSSPDIANLALADYRPVSVVAKYAIGELERCYALGARGVGELGDKGEGLLYSKPTKAYGLHMDDPALRPFWKCCAELGLPVNIHMAEPIWMYEAMDSTNDGLMNAWDWRIDLEILGAMLDRHANLWADIAARYAETAPIPRHVNAFYEKYQDRLLYGTDMGMNPEMYGVTFRILEKVYNQNAKKLYNSL